VLEDVGVVGDLECLRFEGLKLKPEKRRHQCHRCLLPAGQPLLVLPVLLVVLLVLVLLVLQQVPSMYWSVAT
jgi:hypothetical protein